MAGTPGPEAAYVNQLKFFDTDTWKRVCDACKALDAALVADGATPGSNAGKLTCPSGRTTSR